MAPWRLKVLGGVELSGPDQSLALERKAAALLSYLALEGATSRSRLAGLLWPESSEKTARNNLSQLLRRLKGLSGVPLVLGDDLLRLSGELEVDAAQLKLAMFNEDYGKVIAFSGELLSACDYDDLADFSDWLYSEREQILDLKQGALVAKIARLETEGAYAEALSCASVLLELDPISEEAHRLVMRLYYLLGDRSAALRAFARCQEVLKREMDVTPLPETFELAKAIERGQLPLQAVKTKPRLPLSILRPPLLVGREREWVVMAAAWEAGQIVLLCGPPGVGKSRLALDFATAHGPFQRFEARPGDAGAPFAFQARVWRQCLKTHPGIRLEGWVRRELSRLLPELNDTAPPPLTSAEDKVRLYRAMGMVAAQAVTQGPSRIVVEDLHYADGPSAEASAYLLSQRLEAPPQTIYTFRAGELAGELEDCLEKLVSQGRAVFIELTPLDQEAVGAFVASLELEELEASTLEPFATDLHRYTGGNPLFIIETLKSLRESGQLTGSLPQRLLPSGRVSSLLSQRLQRLSEAALRLAWTAAVAQADFTLELASSALETSPFDLAEPWSELERAHIFSRSRFSHDLVYEAVLKNVPAPIKALLHCRCASYLAERGASAARIAQHLLEAGDEARAVPFLMKAAEAAKASFHMTEAVDFYAQAALIAETQGDLEQAFEARCAEVEARRLYDTGSDHEEVLAKLVMLARSPLQFATARHAQAALYNLIGRSTEAERAARDGYNFALQAGSLSLQVGLLNALGLAIWRQNKTVEALPILEQAVALMENLENPPGLAESIANLGIIFSQLDRHHEAVTHYRRAENLYAQQGDTISVAILSNNRAASLAEQGMVHDALSAVSQAQLLLKNTQGAANTEAFSWVLKGIFKRGLGKYTQALECFERARTLALELQSWLEGVVYRQLAVAYLTLGQLERAHAHLELALNCANLPSVWRGSVLTVLAALLHQQGQASTHILAEAELLVAKSGKRLALGSLQLVKTATMHPEQGLGLAQETLEVAKVYNLGGLWIAAATRCAQTLLALDRNQEALHHSESAFALLETREATEFYRGEALLTHYRTLFACHDPRAIAQLEASLAWVTDRAEHHCPPEYRQSFLKRNPVNRAILEAAKRVGLEPTPLGAD